MGRSGRGLREFTAAEDAVRDEKRRGGACSSTAVAATDSWAYHRGSVAFQDDHARDLDLRAAGFTVLRYTECQLEEEPGRVVADVARALMQEASSD